MIWSNKTIDETAGFDYDEGKGTLSPRKYGKMVYDMSDLRMLRWKRRVERGWPLKLL